MEEWADWQKVYQHGILVIWPPEIIQGEVNQLREMYDPVSQSICEGHITLTQPFLRPPGEMEWEELGNAVSSFEPFEIRYGPVNSFLPYPCLWFEIQPIRQVLSIRHALHTTSLFNLDLPHTDDFIPHMTITEGQSEIEVTEDLLKKLRNELSGGAFQLTEIAYIVPDEGFHFGVQRQLPLGKVETRNTVTQL